MDNIKKERLKNHIKMTLIIVILGFIISSYIFGTFDHGLVSKDDRSSVIVLTFSFALIANAIYHESYKK